MLGRAEGPWSGPRGLGLLELVPRRREMLPLLPWQWCPAAGRSRGRQRSSFSLLQRERREGERLLDESFVAGDGWGTREPGDRGGGCVTECRGPWPDETARGHGTELCDGDVVMVCERALLPEAANTLCLCPVLSERPAATSPHCHTLAASPSPVLQATAAFYGGFSPSH